MNVSCEHVEFMLEKWSRWVKDGDRSGLGFQTNPIHKMMKYGHPIRSTGFSESSDDRDAEQVDMAIQALSVYRPQAARTIKYRYLNLHLNLSQAAERAQMNIASFKRHLEQGRIFLVGHLTSVDQQHKRYK